MICPKCKSELLWGADFDNEDFMIEFDGITSMYTCTNDECDVSDLSITITFQSNDSDR
jgi:hypothetical protein